MPVFTKTDLDFDVIIIGAGITGMYTLYRLREQGYSVHVFEKNGEVGGTWTMNRYPGCKLDSESYTYPYSFLPDLLQEWDWKTEFATQPEVNEFFSKAADRMDVRKDVTFNTQVKKAIFDNEANCWSIELDNAQVFKSRFVITCVGALSHPNMPSYPGMDMFRGETYHTYYWPHEREGYGGQKVDFSGKRVGVIGTGSTGVQVVQEVAKTAGELYVFQRHPNWCTPLNNKPIEPARMAEIKARYSEIFARCESTTGGFQHDFLYETAAGTTPEEREALFEELYNQSGFAIWVGSYADMFTDPTVNGYITDFIAKKIRERVKDPKVADKLIPKDHGFGLKRVPMETNYYEAFNQPNVHLVDLLEDSIQRMTPNGIETENTTYDLDMIIYATGFDAIIGGIKQMDIRGIGGKTMKEAWESGPFTYLGVQIPEFPNLITMVGAHNGATNCNIPRCSEAQVNWVADLFQYMKDHGVERIEANEDAAEEWTQHVYDVADQTLLGTAKNSWFWGEFGEGAKRGHKLLVYNGGNPAYRERVESVKAKGYEGFTMRQGTLANA
jgi:(2,2,3-trimethyl-5-oxocyclopent-3-enyl)acetyl-CoA 1,5-monooxygenase